VPVELASEAREAGFRLVDKDVTGSTSDDARRALEAGDPGLLWIVAQAQTQGRGRHGRAWDSPKGNLFASLLLVDPCEMRHAAQFGYLVGLSLHDAICDQATDVADALRLKWPNDLLFGRAKVAGILLEGHRAPGGKSAIIVGIGVNVASAPDGMPYPTARVQDFSPQIDRALLFQALSRRLALRYTQWRASLNMQGMLANLRDEWIMRAAGLDQTVTIRLPSGPREGTFTGLDTEGRLLLATQSGIEAIDAGDLFFPGHTA
jgi:BirA family transcriptional regulator, biotin operon repressor / biotin---[acetyl-CoA-carboxylase] ligase